MFFSLVIMVAVAILAVFFSSYNQTLVEIDFFGYVVEGTIGLLIVIALGIGMLVGLIMMLPSVWKRSFAIQRQRKKMEELNRKKRSKKLAKKK
ncbi:MAG: LapA family protein [Anaerolineae bacterium]|nr:LapA family protein [Anaerolineae bacterium]MDK1081055.1 LapA family protein [Anaerolineae bacterium]MDK1117329.1 LapA family protein [Anaerolineae bacterium]